MPTERVSTKVPLNWKEVWFTNCPMVSANNVDQELGWCREEFKKIGVEYAYFRHRTENNWYPHYVHNLDNLIRFGGLYPPIHVNADIRRTRLLGATWVYEGGCMLVRASDRIFRMKDLKGKKIGISKSLNTIKNDWWRIQEHMGIENMLMLNDMTMDDIELVEFPYPDDWYDKPEMLTPPMNNPSELWMRRDHKHDLAFRPLEKALLEWRRRCDLYPEQGLPALPGADGPNHDDRGPDQLSGLDGAGCQHPRRYHLHRCDGEEHPELVVAYMKAMIKVGRWANENKHAAGSDPQQADLLPGCRGHLPGHQNVDMVPSLSPRTCNASRSARTSCSATGYIEERLRCVRVGRAGIPGAGGGRGARGRVEAPELEQASSGRRARGGRHAAG